MVNSEPEFRAKPVLLSVCGPTAVGKTRVGIALANHFGGEVISADSRQFFKAMFIGTARPAPEELEGVQHHFLATLELDKTMSAGQFAEQASQTALEIVARGHLPIAVGGSGLYLSALTDGIDDLPSNTELRNDLKTLHASQGLEALQARLKHSDPRALDIVDAHNPVRVMRAIELVELTGAPLAKIRGQKSGTPLFRTVKIGLHRQRAELYRIIDTRVDHMLESGLVEEARGLQSHRHKQALQTVGYKELFGYFDGRCSLEEAVSLIKRNTRRYAKRQLTWFGRDKAIRWFEPGDLDDMTRYVAEQLKIMD